MCIRRKSNYQDLDEFFETDEGLLLAQSYLEDEENLLDKKFARLQAKGDKVWTEKREEIEKERRKVKENLTEVKKKRERKVAEPIEREDQEVENGPEV